MMSQAPFIYSSFLASHSCTTQQYSTFAKLQKKSKSVSLKDIKTRDFKTDKHFFYTII